MTGSLERHAAFVERLDAHRGILYKVARAYGASPADRDDIAQEVVVQLWRAFPRYDSRHKFSTWMYRVALNVAISWRRRETSRSRHVVADGDAALQTAGAPDPGDADAHVALLYRCITGYDELHRALLLLYLDGHSHQEIGDVLGISPGNVATRLTRLRQRLRDDFRAAGHL